jgi:FAD/FMN-containing dehydrogenase
MLRTAWPGERTYWKFACKGACQDLLFHMVLNKAQAFTEAIGAVAAKHDYPQRDIGFYVQPLVYGGACHFESNFCYDPDDTGEVSRVRNLYADAAEAALDLGAFFSRPYGAVAEMVFDRTAGYTAELKKVKKVMDPNNVMSPGRLCL